MGGALYLQVFEATLEPQMEYICQLIKCFTDHTIITMGEYEIKKKTTYEVDRKGEAERDLEDASDKVQAGAKAVANKVKDPDKDLDIEYQKEKIKKKFD